MEVVTCPCKGTTLQKFAEANGINIIGKLRRIKGRKCITCQRAHFADEAGNEFFVALHPVTLEKIFLIFL